jgi:hypothetical protein
MSWYAFLGPAVGIVGIGIGLLLNRRSKKQLNVLSAQFNVFSAQVIGLIKKIGEEGDKHSALLPYVKNVIVTGNSTEQYLPPRTGSEIFGKMAKGQSIGWSDLLKEDIIVEGSPMKLSDLLKIEILTRSQ